MGIKETLDRLRETVEQELESVEDKQALEALRVRVMGKKGELTALLRGMGQLSPEERPAAGQMINEAREKFTAMVEARQDALRMVERRAALLRETLDVTEPIPQLPLGSAHPVNLVMQEMVDCFMGMGFEVVEGPEVELDHYNFELMNIPKNHPARDFNMATDGWKQHP